MLADGFTDDGETPNRRPFDLRHFYATNYLRTPGLNMFTLARRMGTSLEMIERTYVHLAVDADEYELALLNERDLAPDGPNADPALLEGAGR